MQKIVILIGFVLLLAGLCVFWILGDNESLVERDSFSEEYIPQVIVEGRWGPGPDEFGMALFEGNPVFPNSLVVDGRGDIFVLDAFNNRIQQFDRKGKYLASIPIESYRRSTDELGFDFASVYVPRLLIDTAGSLYWRQERRNIDKQSQNRFFKYNKSGQVLEIEQSEFDTRTQYQPDRIFVNSRGIRYLIEVRKDKEKYKQNVVIHNLRTNQDRQIEPVFRYPATTIDLVKVDADNNIYVFSQLPPQVCKYDLEGNLLSLVELEGLPNPYGRHPILNSLPYIDSEGNIFQVELIPNRAKEVSHFPKESLGLRIIKWEVRYR